MLTDTQIHFAWKVLEELYPDAECSLDTDGDPFHLFVRAILSAQCTDKRVNEVTATLLTEYPDPSAFAKESEERLGEKIRTCGLYRAKAHAIIASSQMLITSFGGQIPSDRSTLETFPGVGRKIANLILGEVFHEPAVVVDTHCGRVANRIGFSDSTVPQVIEKDLMTCFPREDWITLGHRLVAHGRTLCMARNPNCPGCPVREVCTYACSKFTDAEGTSHAGHS